MLNELEPEKIIREIPQVHERGEAVSRGVHDWVLKGGKPRRQVVDLLHGTFMGHPLHPVLTDVTIGAWVFGFMFDLLSLGSRSRGLKRAADTLLDIGNASAVATAAAGLADYSTIPKGAMATGALHALLNSTGLVLNVLSSASRKQGSRGLGIWLTSISTSILMLSAWLGGELVFKYKVGVNRTPKPPEPEGWTAVMADADLAEGAPRRVEVDETPVLLYRYQGQVHAIGAVCGHAGGPLEEGDFEGHCVTCPWHQSVYDLRDGSVVHGPTTYAEPAYDTRLNMGQIELRLREKPVNEQARQMVRDRL